jgi:hypothetical protein
MPWSLEALVAPVRMFFLGPPARSGQRGLPGRAERPILHPPPAGGAVADRPGPRGGTAALWRRASGAGQPLAFWGT